MPRRHGVHDTLYLLYAHSLQLGAPCQLALLFKRVTGEVLRELNHLHRVIEVVCDHRVGQC